MARIRTIKPAFFKHEDLFDAEKEEDLPLRVAFAGLWTASDREGRFEWRPRLLKTEVLPYDDVDFSRVLHALATRGFIVKYEVDGKAYGWIPTWRKHQAINNRESPSAIPEPPKETNNNKSMPTRPSRVDDACPTPLMHAQAEGEGERERSKEEVPSEPSSTPVDETPVREIVEAWNAMAQGSGLATVRWPINDERRKAIQARWRGDWQRSLDEVRAHFQRIGEDPWCLGQSESNWRADLDYACKPKAFEKVRGRAQTRSLPLVARSPPQDDRVARDREAQLRGAGLLR